MLALLALPEQMDDKLAAMKSDYAERIKAVKEGEMRFLEKVTTTTTATHLARPEAESSAQICSKPSLLHHRPITSIQSYAAVASAAHSSASRTSVSARINLSFSSLNQFCLCACIPLHSNKTPSNTCAASKLSLWRQTPSAAEQRRRNKRSGNRRSSR